MFTALLRCGEAAIHHRGEIRSLNQSTIINVITEYVTGGSVVFFLSRLHLIRVTRLRKKNKSMSLDTPRITSLSSSLSLTQSLLLSRSHLELSCSPCFCYDRHDEDDDLKPRKYPAETITTHVLLMCISSALIKPFARPRVFH